MDKERFKGWELLEQKKADLELALELDLAMVLQLTGLRMKIQVAGLPADH